MIEKPTVFVLGAGASKPFGFPVGRELFWDACNLLNDGLLRAAGFAKERIVEFRETLRLSCMPSVDAFLEHRPSFIDVGKAAIAASLLPFENDSIFTDKWDSGNWYAYIVRHMNAPNGRFHQNKVRFITFNYDRSLEHYFFMSLKHAHGLSDEDAAEQVEGLNILHVYGQLGLFPWQKGRAESTFGEDRVRGGFPAVRYGALAGDRLSVETRVIAERAEAVRIAAEVIRIINEERGEDPQMSFNDARFYVSEAERVIFLGFGYDATNIERLGLGNLKGKEVRGSAYGMTNLERMVIADKYGIGDMGLGAWDALNFLRERVAL